MKDEKNDLNERKDTIFPWHMERSYGQESSGVWDEGIFAYLV